MAVGYSKDYFDNKFYVVALFLYDMSLHKKGMDVYQQHQVYIACSADFCGTLSNGKYHSG